MGGPGREEEYAALRVTNLLKKDAAGPDRPPRFQRKHPAYGEKSVRP